MNKTLMIIVAFKGATYNRDQLQFSQQILATIIWYEASSELGFLYRVYHLGMM